jgi:hypothetical protein
MSFSLVQTDQQVSGVTQNSTTFSCNLGTASSDRIICLILTARINQGTAVFGVPTIGGTNCTQVSGAQTETSDQALIADAWYALIPSGTTAVSVVVPLAFGGDTVDRICCNVFAVKGSQATPGTPVGGSATSNATTSISLTVPSGGAAACGWMNRLQSGTVAWSGATVDATTTVANVSSGTNSDVSCAHATASGTVSVSDAGGDFESVLLAVPWSPGVSAGASAGAATVLGVSGTVSSSVPRMTLLGVG